MQVKIVIGTVAFMMTMMLFGYAALREPARLERLVPEQARKLFEVVWAWETGWKKEYDHRLNCLMTQGAYQLFIGSSPDETARRLVKIVRD